MKNTPPEMGFIRMGVIKGGMTIWDGIFVAWNRKGYKDPHPRVPERVFCPSPRKGSMEVRRWGWYMNFEGLRNKPLRRIPGRWNPTHKELEDAVARCQELFEEREINGDIGTWKRII